MSEAKTSYEKRRREYLAQKAKESRKARLAAGGKRIEVVLHAGPARKLEILKQVRKQTNLELIEDLIEEEAARVGIDDKEAEEVS